MTCGELIAAAERVLDEREASPSTRRVYLMWLRRWLAYAVAHPAPLRESAHAWLTHLAADRRLSAASCGQARSALSALLPQLLGVEACDVLPPAPRRRKHLPDVLTVDEVRRILGHLRGTPRLLCELMYGAGLRTGEAVALRVGQLDLDRHTVTIGERTAPLPASTIERLRRRARHHGPDAYLFPSSKTPGYHMSPSTLQRAFQKAKKRAHVYKHGGPSLLRRSCQAHQLDQGSTVRAVQRAAGYASIRAVLALDRRRRLAATRSPLDSIAVAA